MWAGSRASTPGTMSAAPRRSARTACGWTNRKDIGIPTSVVGLRAPLTGKENGAVREPPWSSGSAQDGAAGAGAFASPSSPGQHDGAGGMTAALDGR